MSSFDYFQKQAQAGRMSTGSNRVPIRPQGWDITLKQNMQNGQTSINLNLRNIDVAGDKQFENVNVDSFEFVALMVYQLATGNAQRRGVNSILSNITNKHIFAVSVQDFNNQTKPYGLYSQRELSTDKFWEHPRIFGILRAVNGQNPNAFPALQQYFGQGPYPVVMDLTFDKENELTKIIGARQNDLSGIIGKAIKVTKSQTAGTVQRQRTTYYLPDFQVTPLTDDQKAKMDQYASQQMQQLIAYDKQVNAQDDLYETIHQNGIVGTNAASLLDDINNAGISTVEQLTTFINNHGGWAAYTGAQMPASPTQMGAQGNPNMQAGANYNNMNTGMPNQEMPTNMPSNNPAPQQAPAQPQTPQQPNFGVQSQQPQQPAQGQQPVDNPNDAQNVTLTDDELPF